MNVSLLIAVLAGAALLMGTLYLVQRRTGDAGIVDAGWAGGLGLAALFYALCADGDWAYRVAMAAVACVWGFRLGGYLLWDRVLHREEDGRYQALRARWGEHAQRNLFFFFEAQALLVALFSTPFLLAASSRGGGAALPALGVAWGWACIAGEALADRQLQRWRNDPSKRGKTCRAGLWRYSRHPNYFFEWLHWWAYPVLCAGSWRALPALAGPLLMFVFLYRVTGIPYTERQALKSRGEDYRAYQRSTNAFFPWFPAADSNGTLETPPRPG